ncbi:hypothetical protein V7S43_010602 [Phytophthora oleae]|uniref:Uncharacterized protein n=1 Tax=Phytophthora oleae TaxID=2107226 RepID=A0ABD3FBK0_9STRA
MVEQQVILPVTCHGVTTPRQAGQTGAAVVRLTLTVKLRTNASRIVSAKVDAEAGTADIFVPEPSSKRHLVVVPTVDTVHDDRVRVSVLNVEGRREQLPAREALATWIPVTEDTQLLKANGELGRAPVAGWGVALKKKDARELPDAGKIDIGDIKPGERDLVIAL